MSLRPHAFSFLLGLLIVLVLPTFLNGQSKKKSSVKKPEPKVFVLKGSGLGEPYKPEPFLSLEPCAKETAEQIVKLENAADAVAQVDMLVKRVLSDDEWVRGCAIYRLGEFGSASTDAVPVLLRILDEEENSSLWTLADQAIWRVPPSRGFSVEERIRDAKSPENSKRLYAVFSLTYFKYPKGSNEAKRILSALIDALSDRNATIVYIASRGIQRMGNWDEDTSAAIPALSELIRSRKVNPLHPLYAMIPMGVRAAPASPLLIEMLIEPEKFVTEDSDSDGIRAYSLRLTTGMVVGQFGSDFVPVLEKYRSSHPYVVLNVLSKMNSDESLRLTLEMAMDGDPEVRAKAIESIPILKPSYAVKVAPTLLAFLNGSDQKLRESAMRKLGSFARYNKEKSEDFRTLYKEQVVPRILRLLNDKELGCYASFTLADIGDEALSAIPSLVTIARKETRSYCARIALYDFGEVGRKHLTPEQIKEQIKEAEQSKSMLEFEKSKPKEIKPKLVNTTARPVDSVTF